MFEKHLDVTNDKEIKDSQQFYGKLQNRLKKS